MKKSILSGIGALASLVLFVVRKRQTTSGSRVVSKPDEVIRIEGAAHRGMMTLIVPIWIAAGLIG